MSEVSTTSASASAAPAAPNHGVVIHAAGDLRVDELPAPEPRTEQAVIRIAYGGICGSDLHYWTHGAAGESILREPMVLGHEVSGVVERAAADGSGPKVGARVTVHPLTPLPGDGSRYPHERPNLAPGSRYLGSAAHFPHENGGFAREIALDTRMLRVLPDNVDLRTASIVEPATVAWHGVSQAERVGASVHGARVAVIGLGPIGALTVAVLRARGAAEIVAIDLFERPLELARAVGATETLVATDGDAIAAVDADIVFEVSGSVPGLASAVRAATRGGTVVMIGLQATGPQPALMSLVITRELQLVGSFRFGPEIDEVIAALSNGSLAVGPVITHEFAIDQTLEAFAVAKDAAISSKVLLKF